MNDLHHASLGKTGETHTEHAAKQADANQSEKGQSGNGQTNGQEQALTREPKWQPVYPGSGRLAGKVAIVTGGDSGIGRAVAALFAREGADVAIVYRHDTQDAQATAAIIAQEGGRALLLQGDVGDPDFCRHAVATTIDRFDRIDVLVNNAGEQHPAEDIRDITPAQLDATFRTNIFGMFHMVQAALDHLERGSAIINCTSVTMYKGAPQLLDYSATKGAITALTRSPARTWWTRAFASTRLPPGRSGPAQSHGRRRSPKRSAISGRIPRWAVRANPTKSPPRSCSWLAPTAAT
jgi:NAD(P)-dependent dehydrogenase (short-subunit alcohol dehydrogenase family)